MTKWQLYCRDLLRHNKPGEPVDFRGYLAWEAGYNAGFLRGKLRGIKTTTEMCSWLKSPLPSSPPPKE